LLVDARSRAAIDAVVVAGTVGIAASGQTGVSVAAAGVYSENNILVDVAASVRDASGVAADSIVVNADNAASINAVAGAASLGASLAGSNSVAVTIGLSLAFNQIGGDTDARVEGVDQVSARSGDLRIRAISQGIVIADFDLEDSDLSAAALDDAADSESDDEETDHVNEHEVDGDADRQVLLRLGEALSRQGIVLPKLPVFDFNSTYDSTDTKRTLKNGDRIRLQSGYTGGGTGGRTSAGSITPTPNSSWWSNRTSA
jgi:hypothetical protein